MSGRTSRLGFAVDDDLEIDGVAFADLDVVGECLQEPRRRAGQLQCGEQSDTVHLVRLVPFAINYINEMTPQLHS